MEYISAYFVRPFSISSLSEHETNLARQLVFNGTVNSTEFLTALAAERILKNIKDTQIEFDPTSLHDVYPGSFMVDDFDDISYKLKSETFQILNFGTKLTIMQKDNRISEVEYIGHLYKNVDI